MALARMGHLLGITEAPRKEGPHNGQVFALKTGKRGGKIAQESDSKKPQSRIECPQTKPGNTNAEGYQGKASKIKLG